MRGEERQVRGGCFSAFLNSHADMDVHAGVDRRVGLGAARAFRVLQAPAFSRVLGTATLEEHVENVSWACLHASSWTVLVCFRLYAWNRFATVRPLQTRHRRRGASARPPVRIAGRRGASTRLSDGRSSPAAQRYASRVICTFSAMAVVFWVASRRHRGMRTDPVEKSCDSSKRSILFWSLMLQVLCQTTIDGFILKQAVGFYQPGSELIERLFGRFLGGERLGLIGVTKQRLHATLKHIDTQLNLLRRRIRLWSASRAGRL